MDPLPLDVDVTIGWLKGVAVSENPIQAVWEAFGVPHQTELQPSLAHGSATEGLVTWNECFEIHNVSPESKDCYLEIAFWQYRSGEDEPTAIGFKKLDISNFHSSPEQVLEFSVEIEEQSTLAHANICLTTRHRAPPAVASEPLAEHTEVEHRQRQEIEMRQEEEHQRELSVKQTEENERTQLAEQEKKRIQSCPHTKAPVEQHTNKSEPAPTHQPSPPAAPAQHISQAAKAQLFRSLLTDYCGLTLPSGQPLSRAMPVLEEGVPMETLVANILDEGLTQEYQESSAEFKEKLQLHLLTFYLRHLCNGREMAALLEQATATSIRTLLRLPTTLTANCFMDEWAARAFAFRAGQAHGSQRAAGKGLKQLVFYCAADRPMGYDLGLLPNVLVRQVPLTDLSVLDEAALQKLIEEDLHLGNLPTLLCAHVGLSGPKYCDNMGALHKICKQNGLIFHLEGPGLLLLMTGYGESEQALSILNDDRVAVSMILASQQLFPLGSHSNCCWSFTRLPTVPVEQPVPHHASLHHVLQLYLQFKGLGMAAIRATVQRKAAEASRLLQACQATSCVELLTDPSNLFTIRFRFRVPDQEGTRLNELNRLLHQLFLDTRSDAEAITSIPLRTDPSGCHYFEYDLQAHDMAENETVAFFELMHRCHGCFLTVVEHTPPMLGAVHQMEQFVLSELTHLPMALACFRLVPLVYRTFERLTESHIQDINSINNKMAAILQKEDPAFQPICIGNQTFLTIAADASFSFVFTTERVAALTQILQNVLAKMEADDEILTKIQAEITKRGIEVAERQIQEMKLKEAQHESVIRLLPVIGSMVTWWSPVAKEDSESLSFDLRTSTLHQKQKQ
eukprot:NODE_199_length_2717_cov_26.244788_g185_i0.p1 GENE.NODE_199_length_2717_cov_26.244788_g185_i0~~NODE_199_length_2717_cov_26.244788_g185_i0.p1  ORF type:complete len:850 (+),score=273.31 NODE_199_length_2717_cov_26.244788_g185_i0:57-2606(+)